MDAVGADLQAGTTPAIDGARLVRLRTGGRSECVRRAVGDALLALMREGQSGFSVAEVDERAGVHRTTVYRWWPTPADLVREALTLHTTRLVVPDTGCWHDDVLALAVELADFFSDPVEMAMNTVLSGGLYPEFDEVQMDYWMPIFHEFSKVIERVIHRGEVRFDTNAEVALHLVTAPLLMHTVLLHSRPDPHLVQRIAEAVSRAFAVTEENAGQNRR